MSHTRAMWETARNMNLKIFSMWDQHCVLQPLHSLSGWRMWTVHTRTSKNIFKGILTSTYFNCYLFTAGTYLWNIVSRAMMTQYWQQQHFQKDSQTTSFHMQFNSLWPKCSAFQMMISHLSGLRRWFLYIHFLWKYKNIKIVSFCVLNGTISCSAYPN